VFQRRKKSVRRWCALATPYQPFIEPFITPAQRLCIPAATPSKN